MLQTELEQGVQFAASTYRELFVERYQREPLAEQIQLAVLRGLVRRHGLKQVVQLLTAYFATTGDNGWYERNGHSMEVFAKSIGALNAKVGTTEKKAHVYRNLYIRVDSVCPTCKEYFGLVCNARDVEKKTHFTVCPECAKKSALQ